MSSPDRTERDDQRLTALWAEVNRTRAAFRAGRGTGLNTFNRHAQEQRTAELATAMEAYAEAAESCGVPVPYRYRNEMRLYRSMAGTAPGRSDR